MPRARSPQTLLRGKAMSHQEEPISRSPATERVAREHGAGAPSRPSARSRGRERTRTSVAFNTLLAGAVVLILLLVFILENTHSVKISYFVADGHIAFGVALLLAAVGGALLVGLVGAARVLQLRHRMRRAAK